MRQVQVDDRNVGRMLQHYQLSLSRIQHGDRLMAGPFNPGGEQLLVERFVLD
tara:strand:+ start:12431 stop:12586 length:156 start_codon:yes stop_codon:yes gene_type:complete